MKILIKVSELTIFFTEILFEFSNLLIQVFCIYINSLSVCVTTNRLKDFDCKCVFFQKNVEMLLPTPTFMIQSLFHEAH